MDRARPFELAPIQLSQLCPNDSVVPTDLIALDLPFEAEVVKAIALTKLPHLQGLLAHRRVVDDHRLPRAIHTDVDLTPRAVRPLALRGVGRDGGHGALRSGRCVATQRAQLARLAPLTQALCLHPRERQRRALVATATSTAHAPPRHHSPRQYSARAADSPSPSSADPASD